MFDCREHGAGSSQSGLLSRCFVGLGRGVIKWQSEVRRIFLIDLKYRLSSDAHQEGRNIAISSKVSV